MDKLNFTKFSCPNAPCVEGAELYGIFNAEGTLSYLGKSIKLNSEFVQATKATKHGKKYRFSAPCVKGLCNQWKGGECSLSKKIIKVVNHQDTVLEEAIPACAIRDSCRWFSQDGYEVCHACKYIVRDQSC